MPASGNLVFNTQTGAISGTPLFEDARDNDPYLVTVTATDGQPGSVSAQTQFELNISALDRANISLDIAVAPAPAMLNDQLQWTLTASNALGPQAVNNVVLNGTVVGAGLTVSSPDSCTIEAPVGETRAFDCAIGPLAVGATASVTLNVQTSQPGDVVIYALAENDDPLPLDPNLDDNSSQVTAGVAEAFSNGAVQSLGHKQCAIGGCRRCQRRRCCGPHCRNRFRAAFAGVPERRIP